MGLFDGKVVLITGSAGGLGRAYAHRFASEGARLLLVDVGADVAGVGSNASLVQQHADELRVAFPSLEVHAACEDVTNPEGARAAVAAALDHFGRIDTLVHSVGAVDDASVGKLGADAWDRVLRSCLYGAFFATQAFAKVVVPAKTGGHIVLTTALAGFTGSLSQANYAAANAGVFGLMKTASIELQKHRITVNAVAPLAKTRQTESLPMFQSAKTLTPEHVAPVVAYLGSDLVGDRTGNVLGVAGSRVFSYRFQETPGAFHDAPNGIWKVDELAAHWGSIVKA